MPTKSPPGVLRGAAVPRVRHAPADVAYNGWEDVVDLAKGYGLVLDDAQANVLEGALGERADGRWAATRVGCSIPRQNGKGSIIEARELAGLLLFGERLIIHSAHEVKTALDGFRRIRSYFENYDDLRKKVRRITQVNGQEGIELLDGRALRFMARSKGSGRGFSADCVILDEAQELSEATFAAILPTMSARPNPQLWLLGTPPAPTMAGDVFGRMRANGHEGSDPRLFWGEWSAAPDADLSDPAAWAAANPALGDRIDPETVAGERAAMDDDTFARERLGMWAGAGGRYVIDPRTWDAVADADSRAVDRLTLAVDVSPDRAVASVALAGMRADGLWHVELLTTRAGTGWVAPYLEERNRLNRLRPVVLDAMSPAATLAPDLKARRVRFETTNTRDLTSACGAFYSSVTERSLRHIDQPQVAAALGVARRRELGDAWAWSRKSSTADITPLVAITLALWGARTNTKAAAGRTVFA